MISSRHGHIATWHRARQRRGHEVAVDQTMNRTTNSRVVIGGGKGENARAPVVSGSYGKRK